MVFYSYELRWKNYKPFESANDDECLINPHKSLHWTYSDMKIQEINEGFYSDYLRHEKYILNQAKGDYHRGFQK